VPSQELQSLIDVIPADFADPAADYKAVRTMFAAFHGHPVGDDLQIDIVDYGRVRCGHYQLPGTNSEMIAFHCHGGAFVSTPLDEYHFYAEMIARHTGCAVVMPDYRLAPEHLFPAAHEDCFDAYCGLLASGIDAGRIVVLGESCGGSLAMGMLLRLRNENIALPAAFVSLTGWFDLSVAGPQVNGVDPFLNAQWVRNRGLDYTNGQVPPKDPMLSPCYADLTGLPPMYLQVGEFDTVREGALLLASQALRAGVEVRLESWPGMIHGWHGLANIGIPEAGAAWQAISEYIESLCSSKRR
jgi:monoterpene epsilon-lactone hydrolase